MPIYVRLWANSLIDGMELFIHCIHYKIWM